MSEVNIKILDTIKNSDYDEIIKKLLNDLLIIEFRIYKSKNPRYSEDYDRIILSLIQRRNRDGI